MNISRLIKSFALCSAFGAVIVAHSMSQESKMDAKTARKEITSAYERWGKAREEVDTKVFQEMLGDDFYAQIGSQKVARAEFIKMVSEMPEGVKLVRFSSQVLTVNPKGVEWIAVITEKLEFVSAGPNGKPQKLYALWITRDGWQKRNGKWQVNFTEAIGSEGWRNGEKPPFSDWG